MDISTTAESFREYDSYQSYMINLPPELVSQIAFYCDARSILHLSQTCRKFNTICYDERVLRARLEFMQHHYWQKKSLDFEAITGRAGSDAQIWARYALADDLAWQMRLHYEETGRVEAQLFKSDTWLPALAVVRHPISAEGLLLQYPRGNITRAHGFAAAVGGLLATDGYVPEKIDEDVSSTDIEDFSFCSLLLRISRHTSAARAWPAILPPIREDLATYDIALCPINNDYHSPVPFQPSQYHTDRDGAASSVRVLQAHETMAARDALRTDARLCDFVWNQWYNAHVLAVCESSEFLEKGLWAGLYTYNVHNSTTDIMASRWDPPMQNLRLQRRPTVLYDLIIAGREDAFLRMSLANQRILYRVDSNDCHDGVGQFTLHGVFYLMDNGQVGFVGVKRYVAANHPHSFSWAWKCVLTPFGLLGQWGWSRRHSEELISQGRVWLWRRQVDEVSTG